MDILQEIIQLREREQSLNKAGYEQDGGKNVGAIIAHKPIGDTRHCFLGINLHGWNISVEEEEKSVTASGEVIERSKVIEERKLTDEDVVNLINSDDFTLQEMNRLLNRFKALDILKEK
ncbi:hypothetical protein D070_13305 [Bacillus velezensis]|uniref:hypothetical protein n=1 Tax=Bacillus velezensis TaxID=492670 RepID=UPI00112BDD08|nr:hypothetical protein [Bacillus velezensis]